MPDVWKDRHTSYGMGVTIDDLAKHSIFPEELYALGYSWSDIECMSIDHVLSILDRDRSEPNKDWINAFPYQTGKHSAPNVNVYEEPAAKPEQVATPQEPESVDSVDEERIEGQDEEFDEVEDVMDAEPLGEDTDEDQASHFPVGWSVGTFVMGVASIASLGVDPFVFLAFLLLTIGFGEATYAALHHREGIFLSIVHKSIEKLRRPK